MALLGAPALVHSQEVQYFTDALGKKGQVRYTGGYTPASLPQQGTIDIRWREMDDDRLKTYRVKGRTRDYLPTGNWIWEEGFWQYQVETGDGIQPVFNTTGRRMRWEGRFIAGQPEGKWLFSLDSVNAAGRAVRSLLQIHITYRKGVPAGTIFCENRQPGAAYKLTGSLDSNGVATGTWRYSYKNSEGADVTEERRYHRGLLTDIVVTTRGHNTYTIRLEHNTRFLQKTADSLLYGEKRIGNVLFAKDEYDTEASERFHEDVSKYFLQGWQLEVFPHTVARQAPAFKRVEQPITPAEAENIQNARALIEQQKEGITHHLAGNIHIHRFRNILLDTTIAYLQLNLHRLNYLDSLLQQTADPLFTYRNREEQDVYQWVTGLDALSITRGEVFDSVAVHYPLPPVSDTNVFQQIRRYLQSNGTTLPLYFRTVESAGIAVRQEGELKALEDAMVQRYDQLYRTYAAKKGIGSIIYQKFIADELPGLLQAYTRTEQYAEAIRMSGQIQLRLDSLEAWESQLDVFDSMPETLRKEYAYMVYNPYNGSHDIEVVAKRKFFQNIRTQLWPFMLAGLTTENDWDAWVERWNQQFRVYYFLYSFVSRDDAPAKRLERRVRRDRTPERMLQHIVQEIKEQHAGQP